MRHSIYSIFLVWLLGIFGSLSLCQESPSTLLSPLKRAVTVVDSIQMTTIQNANDYALGASTKRSVAQFSPGGNRFVIVMKRGNIRDNTNVYSLLVYETASALKSLKPEGIAVFSSSSNRPGIQQIMWVNNHLLAFLAEDLGEVQQLHTFDCDTKELRTLTHHQTNLDSYAIAVDQDRVAFTAEQPIQPLGSNAAGRHGVVVSNQLLDDLIASRSTAQAHECHELFVQTLANHQESQLRSPGSECSGGHVWLSPNGRYVVAIVLPAAPQIPESWKGYKDHDLQLLIQSSKVSPLPAEVYEYELIDIASGQSEPLIDAPIGGHSELVWASDSKFVVVSGTYLPTNLPDLAERELRESTRFVVEVGIPSRELVSITPRDLTLVEWNHSKQELVFLPTATLTNTSTTSVLPLVVFGRTNSGWKELPSQSFISGFGVEEINVKIQEDLNTPPKLLVNDPKTGDAGLLLDPNPQLKDIDVPVAEEVVFKSRDGHKVRAGLYRPPGYSQDRRYPLVIQTHGWDPAKFWIDGPYSTAFAARPLAANGFVVLQLEESEAGRSTPDESPTAVSAYEGAINYLDNLGLVDRQRVGVVGFSRTGLSVEYALTHSRFRYAAAVLADISDAGYFRYMALLNYVPALTADSEHINGGSPFGKGLSSWLRSAPGFNLDKVATPVLMEANSSTSMFFEWEWFAGLSHLSKPVDFIYIPDAAHVLVKPWDRLTSQQTTVDWFCFWLKGEERMVPILEASEPKENLEKQYRRWREMKKMQEENEAKHSANQKGKPKPN